jgi:chromosomal replication initiation ATPase DnaA
MKQLSLPVDEEFLTKTTEFFVTGCNEEAHKFLIDLYDPKHVPFSRIVLMGPKASGKSRLAKMWVGNGLYVNCRTDSLDIKVDRKYERAVIDNFELSDETELLHMINRCVDSGVVVLLVGTSKVQFKIPDLQSRLNSAYQLQILPPDNDLVLMMIQEMCFLNKIKVNSTALDFIKHNINFSTFTDLLSFKLCLQRLCEDNRMKLDVNILRQAYDSWHRV